MGKRLSRDLTAGLAKNPDLVAEYPDKEPEMQPEQQDNSSIMDKVRQHIIETQKQKQEDQNAALAATKDRFAMMKNPDLQGPRLPFSVLTPAEDRQLSGNMAMAAGTIRGPSAGTQSYMKNYMTPEAVEGAIAKGEGFGGKLAKAMEDMPNAKTYSQEKLDKLRVMIDKILRSETIPQEEKTKALQKFKTFENMSKVRGFE